MTVISVKFKKIDPKAITPKKATNGSVGYDLYVKEDICIEHKRQVIPLGFAVGLPRLIEAKIEARSGFSAKGIEGFALYQGNPHTSASMRPLSSFHEDDDGELWQRIDKKELFNASVLAGKVDWDYTGEVGVIILNHEPNKPFLITKGTRIAQMTFYPVLEADFEQVEELSETERGEGSFGHTGV